MKEGLIDFETPDVESIYDADVFYNPEMKLNRDISVAFASLIRKEIKNSCDLLSASGIRGMRYIKEAKIKCHFNDINPHAVKLIKRNLKRNKIDAEVTNKDANLLMREQKFGFIDIDPFGSPIHFIESAVRSLPSKGYLAVTATDTAPLCGTYPKKCLRRYGIRSFKTDYMHELGVRILITSIMKKFFQEEKVFIPLISYSHKHYFRIFGKIESGNSKVDKLLKDFKPISHCHSCGWRDFVLVKKCLLCNKKTEAIESIYMGPIQDKKILTQVGKFLEKNKMEGLSLVHQLFEELDEPLSVDTHLIAKHMKRDVPKMDELITKIKKKKYKVSKTHFSPTSIKTNIPYEELVKLYK